jgi:hypothetical protein
MPPPGTGSAYKQKKTEPVTMAKATTNQKRISRQLPFWISALQPVQQSGNQELIQLGKFCNDLAKPKSSEIDL